jgi:RHS repeat-associated protein
MERNKNVRSNRRDISREHGRTRSDTRKPTPAAETAGIHSNAYNFVSAVTSGVDPRTGMYTSSISLPGVAANNLCGPTVRLGLSFSPLNPIDAGFGIGWAVATTRYDTARRRLSLSSGESFLVDTFDSRGVATFKDRKLRSFDFFRDAPGDTYRIVHKTGQSEHLSLLPGSEGVAALHQMRSPQGHVVTLSQRAINGVITLDRIIDGVGQTLLGLAYAGTATRVTLHPDSAQAAVFEFRFVNHRLMQIDLPEGYGDGWLFGYEDTDTGLLLLKNTTVPTGGYEEVIYRLDGQALPGGDSAPLTHMPVVTECRRYAYNEQPVVRTRYTYSQNRNYFGYGVLTDWTDDEDNLYRIVMPPGERYEYTSTESLYDGGDLVRKVERSFNRFHLLTRERTSQKGCVREVVTVYDEDPAAPFAAQSAWCQLPTGVRTLYYREEDASRIREDVEASTYDEFGNRLSHVDIHGMQEVTSYFPVDGMEGFCPVDPLGFVRSPMETRVSPPLGTDGPVRLTCRRHELLPSLDPGGIGHVVPRSQEWYEEAAGGELNLLCDETYACVDDGGIYHGRPLGTLRVVGGVGSTTAFTYDVEAEDIDARGVAFPVLVITTTRVAGDGEQTQQATTVERHALHDGRLVSEQDASEVIKRVAYDGLGRLIEETASAGSAFEASESRRYLLAHSGSSFDIVTATKQRTRVELDGFGRETKHVAIDWKGDGAEYEIWSASFDVLGQMVSETHTDVDVPISNGPPDSVVLKTDYKYDGWGNLVETIHPGGVHSWNHADPIGLVADEYDEAIVNGSLSRCGHVRTTFTKSGKPLLVERLDGSGAHIERMYVYDGLDRCISETDASKHVTRYGYDAFDRLCQTTLPDQALVMRTYARHSDETWPEGIVIHHQSLGGRGVSLGEQLFDGLGRRTLLRVGRRDTRYTYDAAMTVPAEIRLPSEETVVCRYEKFLGNRLAQLSSRGDLRTEELAFTYHPVHGGLLRSVNDLGTQTVEYLPSGRLASATVAYGEEARLAVYSGYTLKGELTRFTGVDGLEHSLSFDSLGRLAKVKTDTLVTDIAYDAFGRRCRLVTRTLDASRTTDMSTTYDEHGRECHRMVAAQTGGAIQTQTLTHTYANTGHLATRTLVTEEGTRRESYDYDSRGRLVGYLCDGVHGPIDASGFVVTEQRFTFDALDNIRELTTRFSESTVPDKRSTFYYAKEDPTQAIQFVEKQAGRPDSVFAFSYDASGNLLQDEEGRELAYDALGRLSGWTHGDGRRRYRYDPLDRVGAIEGGGELRYRYYDGDEVTYESGGGGASSFHCVDGVMLGQTTDGASVLLGSDAMGSVLSEASAGLRRPVYTVYGYSEESAGDSSIAFVGEMKDEKTGWYLLGSYRAYNPRLMRFHSPDGLSPFGRGGFNSYAYCGGNPVTRVDPTGEDWVEILTYLAIGVFTVAATVLAPGVGTALSASLAGAATTVQGFVTASVVATAASASLEVAAAVADGAGDGTAAKYLGVAGAGLGLLSAGFAQRAAVLAAFETVGTTVSRAGSAIGRSMSALSGRVSRAVSRTSLRRSAPASSRASDLGSPAGRSSSLQELPMRKLKRRAPRPPGSTGTPNPPPRRTRVRFTGGTEQYTRRSSSSSASSIDDLNTAGVDEEIARVYPVDARSPGEAPSNVFSRAFEVVNRLINTG